MAKLTKSLAQPLSGRFTMEKMGGRAKSPFLSDWKNPKPARGFNTTKKKKTK